VSETSYKSGIS